MDKKTHDLLCEWASIDRQIREDKESEEFAALDRIIEIAQKDKEEFITTHNHKEKEARKKEIEEIVAKYFEAANMDTFKIVGNNGGTINFKKKVTTQLPSKKTIKERLSEYPINEQVLDKQNLYEYLVDLPKKVTYEFKTDVK